MKVRLPEKYLELMCLSCNGLETEDIANRLCISKTTVTSYWQQIMSMLGAHSRLHAVAIAYRDRLLPQSCIDTVRSDFDDC